MSGLPSKLPQSSARFRHFAAPVAFALASLFISTASAQSLRQQFLNPPDGAKPMVRWWWFGAAVEKPEILRELQQMKADNIGGVEMAFVYPEVVDDPAKGLVNLPFLSPAFLDDVHYAQAEGRKLGLRVDITLGSGWPYGGPATTLEEAAERLRVAEVAIAPGTGSVAAPKLAEGESFLCASIVNGGPKHWDAASRQPIRIVGDPVAISPAGTPRTVLFFISSHTHQQVKRAALGAEGWVLDPFSHKAVETHLKAVGDSLVKAFGTAPPYAVFSDSLEAYGADWTPALPSEFLKRRGYDLLPHLPELVAGGTPEAEKVRHDWGKTLTELVDENYLVQINRWALAHHTKFRSQTYGEPAVSFSSQRLVSLAEGEGPQWRAFSTLRWATSANHVFGNTVTSGETFTWLHSPVFRATPLDMKAEADIDFVMGENQIICHGWPYSPTQAGEPGWSLYAAAVFNDHNPWHPVMPDVARYIERMSFLLRQGKPANQVALLLPTDDAWSNFSPGKVTVTGELAHLITPELMSSILSAGYNVDFIDADAIDRVGINHPILVIPPTDRIPLVTLRRIEQYVAQGGKVISVGRAPSLSPESKASPEITGLSQQLFDAGRKSFVADTSALESALREAQRPDFDLTSPDSGATSRVGFIRRRLAGSDIYFVTNTGNQPVEAKVSFGTAHKFGEQWNTDNGDATSASVREAELKLAPYESRVFVFSDIDPKAKAPAIGPDHQLADLSAGWQLRFAGTGKTESAALPSDWASTPGTRFYSGEGIYQHTFNLASVPKNSTYLQVNGGAPVNPAVSRDGVAHPMLPNGMPDPRVTRTGPGMSAHYDPPIREAAIVLINGKRAGSLWHPPYRLDVSPYLRPGENRIEIRVYNTALNAWSALPPHDYKPLIAKYGDRFQMQDLNKVVPLPSGILGSIHLISQEGK